MQCAYVYVYVYTQTDGVCVSAYACIHRRVIVKHLVSEERRRRAQGKGCICAYVMWMCSRLLASRPSAAGGATDVGPWMNEGRRLHRPCTPAHTHVLGISIKGLLELGRAFKAEAERCLEVSVDEG